MPAKNSYGTIMGAFSSFNLLHGHCMLLPFPSTLIMCSCLEICALWVKCCMWVWSQGEYSIQLCLVLYWPLGYTPVPVVHS